MYRLFLLLLCLPYVCAYAEGTQVVPKGDSFGVVVAGFGGYPEIRIPKTVLPNLYSVPQSHVYEGAPPYNGWYPLEQESSKTVKNPFEKVTAFQRLAEPVLGISLKKTLVSGETHVFTTSLVRANTIGISYGNGKDLFMHGEVDNFKKFTFKLKYSF